MTVYEVRFEGLDKDGNPVTQGFAKVIYPVFKKLCDMKDVRIVEVKEKEVGHAA